MKKELWLTLVFVLALGMASCGQRGAPPAQAPVEEQPGTQQQLPGATTPQQAPGETMPGETAPQ